MLTGNDKIALEKPGGNVIVRENINNIIKNKNMSIRNASFLTKI